MCIIDYENPYNSHRHCSRIAVRLLQWKSAHPQRKHLPSIPIRLLHSSHSLRIQSMSFDFIVKNQQFYSIFQRLCHEHVNLPEKQPTTLQYSICSSEL